MANELRGTLTKPNSQFLAAQKEVTLTQIVDGLGKLPKDKAQALAGLLHDAFQENLPKEAITARANEIGFSDMIKMNGASIASTASGILNAFDRLTKDQQGELTCNHKAFVDIRQGNETKTKPDAIETVTEVSPPTVVRNGALSISGLKGSSREA